MVMAPAARLLVGLSVGKAVAVPLGGTSDVVTAGEIERIVS